MKRRQAYEGGGSFQYPLFRIVWSDTSPAWITALRLVFQYPLFRIVWSDPNNLTGAPFVCVFQYPLFRIVWSDADGLDGKNDPNDLKPDKMRLAGVLCSQFCEQSCQIPLVFVQISQTIFCRKTGEVCEAFLSGRLTNALKLRRIPPKIG